MIELAVVDQAALAKEGALPAKAAVAATVPGKMSRRTIATLVRTKDGAIRRCYEGGLVEDGTLGGVVEVGWKIQIDGHVSSVNIVRATKRNKAMEECLSNEIMHWEFPPADEPVVVGSYPFTLDARLLARRSEETKATASH